MPHLGGERAVQAEDQRGGNAHRVHLGREGEVLGALPLAELLQLRRDLLLGSQSHAQGVLRAS